MAISNRERVDKALLIFRDATAVYVEAQMEAKHGEGWRARVAELLRENPSTKRRVSGNDFDGSWDVTSLKQVVQGDWPYHFRRKLDNTHRSWLFEIANVRNEHAHQGAMSTDDALRALDTIQRFLLAISAGEQERLVDAMRQDLLRAKFAEMKKTEQKRLSRSAFNGDAREGLPAWRDVVDPHPDVASGEFAVAEFAADLAAVHRGTAGEEYADPREFFRRTHLTEGLHKLLKTVLKRLAGEGGDPVVELQTNFGGGKTHSMLAAYHLCGKTPLGELPGLESVLEECGVTSLPTVQRAVLVGTDLSASQPRRMEDGTEVRTLWGHLAWQLGGREGYDRFREADETGTAPGGGELADFLRDMGPSLILIDEWVAFVRQMYQNEHQLSGGSFDANMTFAQNICEAMKQCPQAIMLSSLPQSRIELGGDGGEQALSVLQNVFKRIATPWTPASRDESFEIVRRRLFEPIDTKAAAARDAVLSEFRKLYTGNREIFPASCAETGYMDQMEAAYPIHPEVFSRLYDDWSSIERFQRTRGVLRLMAKVIHRLCMDDDRGVLILPASISLDDQSVKDDLTSYLDPPWKTLIESDVDGLGSVSYELDRENPACQKLSAGRRVARTIFLGSAPIADSANRGVSDRHIRLGCTQPGESPATFVDALRQLADRSTHLYTDGASSWYATQPNVNKEARQLAAAFEEALVLDRIAACLRRVGDRGAFQKVHACPTSTGDVPDDLDSKLVILGAELGHVKESTTSSGFDAAADYLQSRGNSPRLYRNTLVFLACDEARRESVFEAARDAMAWTQICEEADERNLDNHNRRTAVDRRTKAEQTLTLRIAEAWRWVLVPVQPDPGGPKIEWTNLPLTGSGAGDAKSLARRVSDRLDREGLLYTKMAGSILRHHLDQVLWTGVDHVDVKQLADWFSQFLYLPRLASTDLLDDAIRAGGNPLNVLADGFGYADAWDAESGRYRGLSIQADFAHVARDGSSVLVKPEVALKQAEEDRTAGGGDPPGGDPGGEGAGGDPPPLPPPSPPNVETAFHGHIVLDPLKLTSTAGSVAEHVIRHLSSLGADVRVTIEIDAEHKDGFDEATVRTVSENCRTLKFDSADFES